MTCLFHTFYKKRKKHFIMNKALYWLEISIMYWMTTLSVFIFIKIKILKPAHLEQLVWTDRARLSHIKLIFTILFLHYCHENLLTEILLGQVSASKVILYQKYLRGSALWFWEPCLCVFTPPLRTAHITSKLVLSCTPPVSRVIVHYQNSPLHFGNSIKLNFARHASFIHSGLRNHKGFTLMHS